MTYFCHHRDQKLLLFRRQALAHDRPLPGVHLGRDVHRGRRQAHPRRVHQNQDPPDDRRGHRFEPGMAAWNHLHDPVGDEAQRPHRAGRERGDPFPGPKRKDCFRDAESRDEPSLGSRQKGYCQDEVFRALLTWLRGAARGSPLRGAPPPERGLPVMPRGLAQEQV